MGKRERIRSGQVEQDRGEVLCTVLFIVLNSVF